MASIIKTSIDLTKIPKDKIIDGKKGKYLPVTITLNDEVDQFGNQGPIIVSQTKEERDAKDKKTYLGNVQVVWTNGDNVAAAFTSVAATLAGVTMAPNSHETFSRVVPAQIIDSQRHDSAVNEGKVPEYSKGRSHRNCTVQF